MCYRAWCDKDGLSLSKIARLPDDRRETLRSTAARCLRGVQPEQTAKERKIWTPADADAAGTAKFLHHPDAIAARMESSTRFI